MIRFKTVKESNWKNFLLKAGQFYETARDAYYKKNWNAVGLNAVHAGISACDALTVYYSAIRSASEKHSDAVDLFLTALKNNPDSKGYSRHVLWLISRKNLVEYESRLFYEKEAEEALKHAGRFLSWAKSKLPK
jgi:hypothetical protein